jgi:hypothetical protein
MVLGLSIETFTLLHVVISLIGIVTGLVVLAGMLSGKRLPGWTAVFLTTTVLTTVTGFLFPITAFTPALGVGILSSAILVVALAAIYAFHLAGAWRPVYVITAIAALYLNVFVWWCSRSRNCPCCSRWRPRNRSRRSLSLKVRCWCCSCSPACSR